MSLHEFSRFDHIAAEHLGYPLKLTGSGQVEAIRFKPWIERRRKTKLENASRTLFRENQNRVNNLPYGFVLSTTSVKYVHVLATLFTLAMHCNQ